MKKFDLLRSIILEGFDLDIEVVSDIGDDGTHGCYGVPENWDGKWQHLKLVEPYIKVGKSSETNMIATLTHEIGHHIDFLNDRRRFKKSILFVDRYRRYVLISRKEYRTQIINGEKRAWSLGEKFIYKNLGWRLNKKQLATKITSLNDYINYYDKWMKNVVE